MIAVLLLWPQTVDSASQSQPSQAYTASADDQDRITTIRSSVQEVNLVFTATDKRGKFQRDLLLSDLTVLDDGKPPAAVRSFRSETDLPLRVGLVLDVSGSISNRFSFEQEAAISFFNQILRPKTDQAFVLAFDAVPTLTQDFSDDSQLLAKGVMALQPGGGSAVFDAIHVASQKLMKTRDDQSVRRVIVLISDGEDNQSRVSREEMVDFARRAQVTIYTISTNTSNILMRGDKLMARLAEETGGRAFLPNSAGDVVRAFKSIEEELRSQYSLSYRPADFVMDGRYRRIKISARGDKKLVIRARKGYFASVD